MALTYSKMIELGAKAPDFTLQDTVSGKIVSLSELKSDIANVVVFICNHCPYVHHINSKLVEIAVTYQQRGVRFIAISSNDVKTHPEDAPEYMTQTAKKHSYPFPYLYDETQETAKAFGAACTPDFFIFDCKLACVYRGRFDDTRPNMGQASTGKDLSDALDMLITGGKISGPQHPSMGCNIKWK